MPERAVFAGAGNEIINGGNGDDILTYHTAMSGISINLALTTAQATGGSGSDTIAGFENLSGSAYNDILKGNAGNNTIMGYNGNDTIYAIGTTTDYMDGGNGSDTINYTKAETGVSVDLALTTAQSTGGAGINTILNFENLSGSGYNDILKGNALNNTIMGYNGNDVLNGGDGNDILSGGNGTDTLTGGSGSDIFIFESPLNHIDTISDFIALNDTIKLENAIFTVLSSIGTLNATNFIASTSAGALDVDDYILYNTSTGVLLYDMDGSGAGMAIQFATLTGTPAITNADFVVI